MFVKKIILNCMYYCCVCGFFESRGILWKERKEEYVGDRRRLVCGKPWHFSPKYDFFVICFAFLPVSAHQLGKKSSTLDF